MVCNPHTVGLLEELTPPPHNFRHLNHVRNSQKSLTTTQSVSSDHKHVLLYLIIDIGIYNRTSIRVTNPSGGGGGGVGNEGS